jgi:hypothetical protein
MTAREMFDARALRIIELSASIEEMAELLAGIETVDWGHVGSLGHVEQLLTEVHAVMEGVVTSLG